MKQFITRFSIVLLLCLSFSLVYSGCNREKTEPVGEEPPSVVKPVEFSQGIWLWGRTLTDGNLQTVVDKLVENNVSQVYLLVKGYAGTRISADKLTKFITKAHAKKLKVYLWYIINRDRAYLTANPRAVIYHSPKPPVNIQPYPMYDDDPIVNPRVNLLYPGYKEYVLDGIRYFLTNFNSDGIHLDYIRCSHFVYSFDPYSLQKAASLGCDTTRLLSFFNTEPNYEKYAIKRGFVDLYIQGDRDVVKWVEMRKNVIFDYVKAIRETIDQIKPGLEFNAAFMAEGATDPAYADVFYAQNYKLLSPMLDMISPMAYFKDYRKSTAWLQAVAEGAKGLVDPQCKIYMGLQAYDGVTAEQLKEQIQYSFAGGADGIIVFQYATVTPDSWRMIKEWNK